MEQAIIAYVTWKKLDETLGLNFNLKIPARIVDETAYVQGIIVPVSSATSIKGEEIAPSEIIELANNRKLAKQAKDFKRADAIRDELKAKGWVIEDSPKGIKLKKI